MQTEQVFVLKFKTFAMIEVRENLKAQDLVDEVKHPNRSPITFVAL